ncbi:hypothetical protein [Parenemella sanctibonifatiensis]|uniref:Uncharacterized protein n=1 Tax=Parenemella sanctibonifatiensis TaxID=2016505 RepID=A0A255EKI6_9ACTN|nr:hypothetical protein [Parenemella sanctibonifatiensis]OYN92037.1 hypothetical protein CGZ91_00460 [Parenemella sanctibonifatiensis]
MGDPEIDAMSAVANALADLEEESRDRVLRWAADRYGVTISTGGRQAVGGGVNGESPRAGVEEIAEEVPDYQHFAELFAAASPKSNEDKALVAAYWIQVHEAHESWASRLLNAELKNLGHSIPNITDALSSNMRKKPQRVIQLKKSGNSRQANKTYKVTHEGLAYVQGMLHSESDV